MSKQNVGFFHNVDDRLDQGHKSSPGSEAMYNNIRGTAVLFVLLTT